MATKPVLPIIGNDPVTGLIPSLDTTSSTFNLIHINKEWIIKPTPYYL